MAASRLLRCAECDCLSDRRAEGWTGFLTDYGDGSEPTGAKALQEPWPLEEWPGTPARYLLCRDDRMFPAAWARRHARERLGIDPDEMDGGHYIALSRPRELAHRLAAYAAGIQ